MPENAMPCDWTRLRWLTVGKRATRNTHRNRPAKVTHHAG